MKGTRLETHVTKGWSVHGHARVIEKSFAGRNEKRDTLRVSRFPWSVEARGIEPRSEHDSDTAPTCVDKALWSRYLGASSALVATSL